MQKYTLFCLLISHLFLLNSYSTSISLSEVLKQVNQNPQIKAAYLEIENKLNTKDSTLGNMLPDLSLKSTFTKQYPGNIFNAGEQQLTVLTLVQPLFKGFKEIKAWKIAEKQISAQKQITKSLQLEVHLQVVNIYFELLQMQEEIKLNQELLTLSKQREQELTQRVKIGQSRMSELIAAKSQTLNAQIKLNESQNNNLKLKNNLLTLLGNTTNAITPIPPSSLETIQQSKLDYNKHPAFLAASYIYEASQEGIDVLQADHSPTLDVRGNYYLDQQGTFNQREWDVSVNLVLPIYSGGKTSAAVKTAKTQAQQAYLEREKIKLEIKNQIEQIFYDYQNASTNHKTLEKAVALSFQNYQLIKDEYKLSLVTNLEVISALNQYIEEKRNYKALGNKAMNSAYQLKLIEGVAL
jgi:outer membrane protein